MDPEVEVLIPNRVSAVLDCACLERVAGGRGQVQSHIAVRGCDCRKEEHVSGMMEDFPRLPLGPLPFPSDSMPIGLSPRPLSGSSLQQPSASPASPGDPPTGTLKQPPYCLLTQGPGKQCAYLSPWKASHWPGGCVQ